MFKNLYTKWFNILDKSFDIYDLRDIIEKPNEKNLQKIYEVLSPCIKGSYLENQIYKIFINALVSEEIYTASLTGKLAANFDAPIVFSMLCNPKYMSKYGNEYIDPEIADIKKYFVIENNTIDFYNINLNLGTPRNYRIDYSTAIYENCPLLKQFNFSAKIKAQSFLNSVFNVIKNKAQLRGFCLFLNNNFNNLILDLPYEDYVKKINAEITLNNNILSQTFIKSLTIPILNTNKTLGDLLTDIKKVKSESLFEEDQNKPEYSYYYKGPVYRFDDIFIPKWVGSTKAKSDKQALNQLTFQFKTQNGWLPNAAFHLSQTHLLKTAGPVENEKESDLTSYNIIKRCPKCNTHLTDGGYCPVCDDGDEEILYEEIKTLDITTPYMLRKDGRLIRCGEIHPYIKMSQAASDETNLKTLEQHPEFLNWFESYVLDDSTAELIDEFEKSTDINEKYDLMNLLNDITNQEFCRVRTSNYKVPHGGNNGEIYFRISSDGFNWLDLIWNIVNRYQKQIKNVTIVNDKQSKGGKEFDYYYDHIPVDKFLTLKGTPVIENCNNIYYNNVEEDLSMKKKKQLIEYNKDIFADEEETEKDKEFDKKFGKYDNKPLSSEEFHKIMQEMIDFYE